MEGEVPYWMNSLFTKLGNHPIYEDIVEDMKLLAKVHSSPWRREMDFQARVWMNHVRELAFLIEDWVDQKPATMDMGARLEIQEDANKFKTQIKQALELHARYNLANQLPNTTRWFPVLPDGRSCLPYLEERRGLLALDESISHLKEHLIKGGMMLKVVSIFGMEGSGKTSLAKEMYAKLQWQFDCQAFVSVGRRASARTTLLNILRQVKPGINPRDEISTSQDVHKLRTELWEYLGTKRYFIVLDGLWSKCSWKVINCALPDKKCGSRVLTTTCIFEVAECCSMHSNEDLYAMKPLSKNNSKILLQRSFRVENNWTLHFIHEFSADIAKICEYMPLAIIVAAGLLSRISEGLANEKVNRGYILGSLKESSASEGMTMILDMSYAHLCLPLKYCFLYLSVFPEEYTIMKDRLIWLWRAEEFIPSLLAGECYFKELIVRGLIQPVFNYDDDEAVGCTVHGVIHDYIRSLSREENFVTVGADLSSGIFPCSSDTVRRFSLDCCNDRDEAHVLASSTTHLLSMRSLTVFGDTEEWDGRWALPVSDGLPVLPCFKLVRVLDLEDADNLRSQHLKGVEGLTLLKYLGLRGTGIEELSEDIGKMEHLEVLDVRQTNMRMLPASIVRLKRLMRLQLDSVTSVTCDIELMEGLEEVSTIALHSVYNPRSPQVIMNMLRRLSILGVSLAGNHNSYVITFLSQVMRCDNLLSISIYNLDRTFLCYLYGPPVNLSYRTKLEVTISGPIPSDAVSDITSLVTLFHLHTCRVTHLHMEVTELTETAVSILTKLPRLVLLKLVSAGKDTSRSTFRKRTRPSRCTIKMDDFVCLEVLWLTCRAGGMELQFEPGAMPKLRRLGLCFSARGTLSGYGDFKFGIQHLQGLTRVHATICCKGATISEVGKAEAAIREQAGQAGCTEIKLRRELEDKMLAGERIMDLLSNTTKRFTSLFK